MAVGRSDLLPTDPTDIPDFDLARFRRLMADLRGTPVLVYAWASWCGPCYREADQVAAIARALDGRVQSLGLNIQDHPTPACEFVRRFGWTFPSVADPRKEVLRGLGFIAPPVTVLYDAEGVEVSVWSGPITESTVRAEIEKALAG
jgi:cytochrome c-type biogenesis protein CcmF